MDKIIILENLRILNLILFILKKKIKSRKLKIYYINSNSFFHIFRIFIIKIFLSKPLKLNFKMINIRGQKNQMIGLLIANNDLFKFEKECKENFNFKIQKKISDNIINYLLKSIFAKEYISKSPYRSIYLINVINNIFNLKGSNIECYFFLDSISNFYLYEKYADDFNIKLIKADHYFQISKTKILIFKTLIKKIIYKFNINKFDEIKSNEYKVFCEGKSQPRLILNGERSDFHWLLTSSFNPKNTLYNCNNREEQIKLKKFGINVTSDLVTKSFINKTFIKNEELFKSIFSSDFDYLDNVQNITNYEYNYNKWINYFGKNNVKVFLNWYKYDANHIPMHDAINDLGGISTFYQPNFDGMPFYECKLFCDINFCNSNFSTKIDKLNKSKILKNVVVGYPSIPITDNMIVEANFIRNNLMKNGAKKIICVLDENSLPDDRWHSGHELQIENYNFILEELFKNKNLGVIFKPKSAYDLRSRIKDTNYLLDNALNTNRCVILDKVETNNSKFTKPTPSLAALASDLVIHSHLCAGTAAIETALIKKPTILIDRESAKNSIFYELLNDINIYSNWQDAIKSINENFLINTNPKFGNWDNAIEFFDPFFDNNGSRRIGDFLNEIVQEYKKNKNKNDILEKCFYSYQLKWGKDKILN